MRPVIGIDVGWSEKRRSCAIAIRGANVRLRGRKTEYENGPATVTAQKMHLAELCEALAEWAEQFPAELASAVIVIDGPLGRNGPPDEDRRIDTACGTNEFNLRAQPVRISHPSTKAYLDATYRIVDSLGTAARDWVWLGGPLPESQLVIGETNPTVGLCLLVPKQEPTKLPSRKKAMILTAGGRSIRAKSDWYWAIGAKEVVANILGSPKVKEETDHELVAGLYCLAVALQLAKQAANRTEAVAIGDEDGVYVVSGTMDGSWISAVQDVGVVSGLPVSRDDEHDGGAQTAGAQSVPVMVIGEVEDPESDASADHGDSLYLYICDSGGVHAKHNDWLRGQPEPVKLVTDDGRRIELSYAENNTTSGHWKSKPTAKEIAKAYGHDSLSQEHPLSLHVHLV